MDREFGMLSWMGVLGMVVSDAVRLITAVLFALCRCSHLVLSPSLLARHPYTVLLGWTGGKRRLAGVDFRLLGAEAGNPASLCQT